MTTSTTTRTTIPPAPVGTPSRLITHETGIAELDALAVRHAELVDEHRSAKAKTQALHAALLAFRHPITGERLDLRSEWPADLGPALAAAGDSDLVAQSHPLRYLLFYERDA